MWMEFKRRIFLCLASVKNQTNLTYNITLLSISWRCMLQCVIDIYFPHFTPNSYQFFLYFFTGFLLFLSIFVCTNALRAIDNSLNSDDNARLKQVFTEGLKSDDLPSVFFSALNLFKELPAQEKNAVCSRLAKLHSDSKLNVSFA